MRSPAVAGLFYPSDPQGLLNMIDQFLNKSKSVNVEGSIRALVVPHAGYIYSGIVAAAGYKLVKNNPNIRKVVILGPSHYVLFRGAAAPGIDVWETPLGMFRVYDLQSKLIAPYPEAHRREHSIEVQMPFLQVVLPKAEYYPVVVGEVDPAELARDISNVIDSSTIIVVSSDLSHYYPYDEAVKIDANANECIPKLDIDCVNERVEACGKTGILTLMHIARERGWKGKLIDYKNSGDTAGDKDSVVGYGAYVFYE